VMRIEGSSVHMLLARDVISCGMGQGTSGAGFGRGVTYVLGQKEYARPVHAPKDNRYK